VTAPMPRWFIRVASAAILLPSLIAIVWKGGFLFTGLLVLALALALREWIRLAWQSPLPIVMVLLGLIYLGMGFIAFYKIRMGLGGPEPAFLFMALIWLSDIGAYVVGKTFKGPKMTPRISPNKTWAGLIGAMLFPAAALLIAFGFSLDLSMGHEKLPIVSFLILVSILIGLAGQLGDLLLSAFKRWVNAKDTGTLIPGHGGILDRLDSMVLSGMVFLFVMKWIGAHFSAVG
jgi:phosphatidate cytidylyltransferase